MEQKIRVTKIKEVDHSTIQVGEVFEGYLISPPEVGKPFFVNGTENKLRTSLVQEILTENTFRTYNSIYKWEKIK